MLNRLGSVRLHRIRDGVVMTGPLSSIDLLGCELPPPKLSGKLTLLPKIYVYDEVLGPCAMLRDHSTRGRLNDKTTSDATALLLNISRETSISIGICSPCSRPTISAISPKILAVSISTLSPPAIV
jgi:hypothetical protein